MCWFGIWPSETALGDHAVFLVKRWALLLIALFWISGCSGNKPEPTSIEGLSQRIKDNSNDWTAYLLRGVNYYSAKEYDLALDDFNKAIYLNPESGTGYLWLGMTWSAKNDTDKALKNFSEAIRLDEKKAYALQLRGEIWQSKGEFDKAIA